MKTERRSENHPELKDDGEGRHKNWSYLCDEEKPFGQALIEEVSQQLTKQATRYETISRYASIYEYGFRSAVGRATTKAKHIDESILAFNHSQTIIHSIADDVVSQRLFCIAMTKGGNLRRRRQAETITRGLEGEFDACGVDEELARTVSDFAIAGLGIGRVYRTSDNQLAVMRVVPLDVGFPDGETRYGTPRTMWQRHYLDRGEAIHAFKKGKFLLGSEDDREDAIESASSAIQFDSMSKDEMTDDTVEIIEAFALPCGPGATKKDSLGGWQVYVVRGAKDGKLCELYRRPWTRDHFPFWFYCPRKAFIGKWGVPVMRQLAAGQREHEKVTAKLQRAHHRVGGLHVLYGAGNLKTEKITNEAGVAIRCGDVNQVKELTPMPAHPSMYSYRDSLPGEMMRTVAASAFVAQGEMPEGIRDITGKALAIQKRNHAQAHKPWYTEREKCVTTIAKLMLEEIRDILDDGGEYTTEFVDRSDYEAVNWREVLKGIDDPVLRVYSAAWLSEDPTQRQQELSALMQAGVITPSIFRRLYSANMPVADHHMQLEEATMTVIEHAMDRMLLDNIQMTPEPTDDLKLCVAIGKHYVNWARTHAYDAERNPDGIEEERIQKVRNYIALAAAAEASINAMNAGILPPGAVPGGGQPIPPEAAGAMPPDAAAGAAPPGMGGPPSPPVGPGGPMMQ